jgi:hypothetical protein
VVIAMRMVRWVSCSLFIRFHFCAFATPGRFGWGLSYRRRTGDWIRSSTCALVTHAQAAGAGSIWASPENEPGRFILSLLPAAPRSFEPALVGCVGRRRAGRRGEIP